MKQGRKKRKMSKLCSINKAADLILFLYFLLLSLLVFPFDRETFLPPGRVPDIAYRGCMIVIIFGRTYSFFFLLLHRAEMLCT